VRVQRYARLLRVVKPGRLQRVSLACYLFSHLTKNSLVPYRQWSADRTSCAPMLRVRSGGIWRFAVRRRRGGYMGIEFGPREVETVEHAQKTMKAAGVGVFGKPVLTTQRRAGFVVIS
jgi:hypothetical protein